MIDPVAHLAANGHLGQIYVGGVWTPPHEGGSIAVINPATGDPIAQVCLAGAADVDAAVKAARAAFPAWSGVPTAERARLLAQLHALLLEHADCFAKAISLEMGAPITYARTAQVPMGAEHVRVAAENLAGYPFHRMRGTTAVVKEPVGVVGLITPWNWPLYQITAKVSPALAAGCTAVLKPSELSPLSALLFAEAVDLVGFPPGVFNLVPGTGPVVGEAMARHPGIDMISITGSTRAGIQVSKVAADTVKRVALELGGKSPNVILPDADLARAVPSGVAAAMRNVGQSCSAPTRMIVPRARLAEVEQLATQAVAAFHVGDPADERTTHGPVANRAQYDRVQQMIAVGLAEGARLLCGGPGHPEGLEHGNFARLTVFSDVRSDMRIAQDEIFGPVLVLIPYDTIDEAVRIANDTVYGLGGHVQGADLEQARAVAGRIRSGQVHINYPAWDPQAPFGGFKQSGNGREYGIEGMEEFLETKAILGFANA